MIESVNQHYYKLQLQLYQSTAVQEVVMLQQQAYFILNTMSLHNITSLHTNTT